MRTHVNEKHPDWWSYRRYREMPISEAERRHEPFISTRVSSEDFQADRIAQKINPHYNPKFARGYYDALGKTPTKEVA